MGTGKSGEKWKLSFTAEHAHFALESSGEGLSWSRAEVSAELQIGTMGPKRATLVTKKPQKRILTFDVAALEYLQDWLGDEATGFRQRILRTGWGVQLGLGLIFLVGALTIDEAGEEAYLSVAIGALLVIASLLARFTMNPASMLVSALAWMCFAASIVLGVLRGSSPWVLFFALLMVVGLPRAIFLYRFLSRRPPSKS